MNLAIVEPVFFVVAIVFGLFLFWRAGRHEFIDSELLYDSFIVSLIGALLGGRLAAFILLRDQFGFSIYKLIFFNVYSGFNFYGALVGAILAWILYFSKKRQNFWQISDLAAAPLAFGQSISSLGSFIAGDKFSIYSSAFFLILFIVLKRLATQKKRVGFFASFYLVSFALFTIAITLISKEGVMIAGKFPFDAILSLIVFSATIISWYVLAKRSIKRDLKSFFAFLLLSTFKFFRTITNVREANEIAKFLIFSPFYLVQFIMTVMVKVFREFMDAGRDFLQVLGVRK